MDPSQLQSDQSNDVHSLESNEGGGSSDSKPAEATVTKSGDGKVQTTDASGGSTGGSGKPADTGPPRESVLKRLWHKFNIYLMLFILVIAIAVGTLIVLTVKSKRDANKQSLVTQGLSQSALQELANSDVTVGDAKQVLTVQSNAIFAGSVLIRSSLDVAGSLKVGGELTLAGLKVTGASQLNDASANNLTVTGALNLQGALTIKSGISVGGNSNFTGNVTTASLITGQLQLNGDLNLTHHITAGGTIPAAVRGTAVGSGGTISLSGSDTAGSVTINTGTSPPAGCFAAVTFSQKFTSTPRVVISPVGSGAADLTYYVDRSTTGFSICTTTPPPAGQTFAFDYIVFA